MVLSEKRLVLGRIGSDRYSIVSAPKVPSEKRSVLDRIHADGVERSGVSGAAPFIPVFRKSFRRSRNSYAPLGQRAPSTTCYAPPGGSLYNVEIRVVMVADASLAAGSADEGSNPHPGTLRF